MLTHKKSRFAREYLVDLNATQAAIRAGYSAKTAGAAGCRLLKDPDIKRFVDNQQAAEQRRYETSRESIIGELALLGFSNPMDYIAIDRRGKPRIDLSKLTREQAAALTEIDGGGQGRSPRIKLADKRGALMDLAKLCGYIIDKPALLAVSLEVLVNASRDPKIVNATVVLPKPTE